MASHPNARLFELLSLVQELEGSRKGLDDAIAELAAWMEVARDRLTDDDWMVLGQIGALLHRVAARTRLPQD